MRTLVATAILAIGLSTAILGTANAQSYSNDVMTSCNQSIGQMKFEGWPADRNREMMMNSCLNNHGSIPGAVSGQNQRPAALHAGPRARQQSAPGG